MPANKPKVKVGVVGCGNIVPQYFTHLRQFQILDVVACADIDQSLAKARAEEFSIPRACTVDELIKDPEIQIVVNLTPPKAHASMNQSIIAAGKHPHTEKPFGVNFEEGKATLAAASEKGILVGCAPDTFLGAGLQTCRKLIDEGWIGRPLNASAFMLARGMEMWHPNCDFFYQHGGGPMMDMGPYYLTALTTLLGSIKRISGAVGRGFDERVIGCAPRIGERVKVETPTYLSGVMEFANGVIGTITMSFDTWAAELPRIEIYGTEGTLSLPDPNTFEGPVRVWRPEVGQWREMPLTHAVGVGRGIGTADLASAILNKRAPRASGSLGLHVLEAMLAFEKSSVEGRHMTLETTIERPLPLPQGLRKDEVD